MDNILITGISGGIGHAVAEKLLVSGSTVIGVALDTQEAQMELAEQFGDRIHSFDYDLMDTVNLEKLIKEIVSQHGPIGGFVHCAGFDIMAPLSVARLCDIEDLWRIHALVPMRIISLLSKKKYHRDGMSIVLITSQSAHEGAMGHTAYAAAKGAIEGYLAPAAAELMEKGIRINEVCFGPIRTQMAAEWMDKLTVERRELLVGSYPLGIGEPSDAAHLICFLLSGEANYINGQIITADGGHSVRKV